VEVKFTLTLEDAVIDGRRIDRLIIDWIDESDHDRLVEISRDWVRSRECMAGNLVGLCEVGELTLAMEAT